MDETIERGLLESLKGDSHVALQVFRPLAGGGNTDAQYHLGYMYQTGTGVGQNSAEALKWYQRAALQGHNSAAVQVRVVNRTLSN